MLPERTERAVISRWNDARKGMAGTAALKAYVAEITPSAKFSPWSEYEDNTFIRAHKKGKTMKEIAAMLPGRTECAVRGRWNFARHQGHCTAALVAYAAEFTPSEKTSPWSPEEDQTFIRAHKEGKTSQEIAAMLPGRTEIAVQSRWNHAKRGTHSSAPLLAYAAEQSMPDK